MGFSTLQRILITERHRPKAANVGFAIPAMQEIKLETNQSPLLATNMKNTFLLTIPSIEGVARYGFSKVTLEEEENLLVELHRSLLMFSEKERWDNTQSSIQDALDKIKSTGGDPKFIIVSESMLEETESPLTLEDARKSMMARGYVSVVDNMYILLSSLPEKTAIVTCSPKMNGFYTRVGDYLGILLQRVSSTIMLVGESNDMAG